MESTEFNKAILNQLKDIRVKLQIDLSFNQNLLLTTYNIEVKISKIKSVLSKFKHPVHQINEFPFRQLFDFVIVRNRNTLEFVVCFNDSFKDRIFKFNSLSTDYLIRKTKHFTLSSICIY